jgi:hypothetical protein
LKIEGSEIIKFAYSPLPFETLLEAAKERKTHQMPLNFKLMLVLHICRTRNYLMWNITSCNPCSEVFSQDFSRWGLGDGLREENPADSLIKDHLYNKSSHQFNHQDVYIYNPERL